MKQLSRQRSLPTHGITAYGVIVYDFNFNSFVFVGSKDMRIFLSLEKAKQRLAYIARRLYEKSTDHEEYQLTDYRFNTRGFILKGSYEHFIKLRHRLKYMADIDAVEKESIQLKLKKVNIDDNDLIERMASIRSFRQDVKYKQTSDGQYINY